MNLIVCNRNESRKMLLWNMKSLYINKQQKRLTYFDMCSNSDNNNV